MSSSGDSTRIPWVIPTRGCTAHLRECFKDRTSRFQAAHLLRRRCIKVRARTSACTTEGRVLVTRHEVAVILPALNEAQAVGTVVEGFLREGMRVIVVDNGSTDGTGPAAARAGAEVVNEERRGYGSACLKGISYLTPHPPSIVVFADCDGTLDPHDIVRLIAPIESEEADVVLGRRAHLDKGALPTHQRLGNAIACFLFETLYGLTIRDIPPYRALRWSFLSELGLSDRTFGLPVETIALAARRKGHIEEIDVSYRVRLGGESKVTGSFITSLRAGVSMIVLLIGLRFRKVTI